MYTIYMTTECNFQCSYCYESYSQHCTITRKTMIAVIDFIFAREKGKRIRIGFLGGEPLLGKELIYEAIEYIESKYPQEETAYYLTTNCSLMDDKFIEMMSRREFHIRVSLDGDEETHKENRIEKSGKNSYPFIIENALKIKDRVTECSVRMTVAENAVSHICQNVIYFHKLGFRKLALILDINLDFTAELQEIFQEQMNQAADYYLDTIRQGKRVTIDLIEGKFISMLSESESSFAMCGAGITSFNIMPDGKVYPCSYLTNDEKFCIGDVFHGIDENKPLALAKQHFDSGAAGCSGCKERKNCHGMKCGYLNYVVTEKINVPSQCTCQQEKIMYPILERVLEEISNMGPDQIQFMEIYFRLIEEDGFVLTPIGRKIRQQMNGKNEG